MMHVYDEDESMLAVLENADACGYHLPHNDLWKATFTLPQRDPKNAFCQMHNFVDLEDGPRKIGKYRIIKVPDDEIVSEDGEPLTSYECEHVMATLLDDVLFGYHEIGGEGIYTEDVARYILAAQSTPRWQLGECDFHDQFLYKFENADLLSALFSLGQVLTEPYDWIFDTSTTPWTVSLKRAELTPSCGIYYARNMKEIRRTQDATTVVTRLYLLGYGEGVNQLTVADINGGLPYIDADNIDPKHIKAAVFVDRRFEDAEALMARGQQLLDTLKIPYTTYTARCIDLVQMTGGPWDEYMPGRVADVMDSKDGIEFTARIVSVDKDSVNGRPGDVEVTIANSVRDITDSINSLADRQGINELYSQGATNLYAQQFADNADDSHPARMRIYVPDGCVRINKMLLSYEASAFRAYETGAAAGGGTTTTTEAGGGRTQTSSSGGAWAETLEQRIVNAEAATKSARSFTLGDNTMTETGENTTGLKTGTTSGNTGTPIGAASGTSMTSTGTGGPTSTGSGGPTSTGSASGNTGTPLGAASGASMTSTGTGGPTSTGSSSGSVTVDKAEVYTGASSPGTSSSGTHSHTVDSHSHGLNSHTHSFSDSYSLAWGHTHAIKSGASNTQGVNNYSAKTISISGTTGGNSGSTGTKSPGTDSQGSHSHTVNSHSHDMTHSHTASGGSHSHSVDQHTHGMNHYHAVGSHSHSVDAHSHSIDQHTHGMNHYHEMGSHSHSIPAHTHDMNHYHDVVVAITIPSQKINIPDHTHSVSIPDHDHSVTLDDHTHDIVYGIYEGTTASSVTLRVDGQDVHGTLGRSGEIDIVPYLEKDEEGRILRGTYHTIELVPDKLTRIEASLFVQTFIQSVGGGNY